MKTSITLLLVILLALFPFGAQAPEHHAPPPPQPQFLLQCIVAGLILGIGYVVIRAILKLCDKCLPPPPPPPTNLPPYTNGVPYTNPSPALTLYMGEAQTNPVVILQHQDSIGGPWENEYTFTMTKGPNGLTTVARDTNGLAVATNFAAYTSFSGDANVYGINDFTGQFPALINPPPRRFYRLVVAQ